MKTIKKSLGTAVFLSWMPLKICDCDNLLSTTPWMIILVIINIVSPSPAITILTFPEGTLNWVLTL